GGARPGRRVWEEGGGVGREGPVEEDGGRPAAPQLALEPVTAGERGLQLIGEICHGPQILPRGIAVAARQAITPPGVDRSSLTRFPGSIRSVHNFPKLSQLRPTHAAIVRGLVWLELFPARERTDQDGVEACVGYQPGRGLQALFAVARERDAQAVALSVCLALERLEVDRVESLHPPSPWKFRCR